MSTAYSESSVEQCSVSELFQSVVNENPAAQAVVFEERVLTFEDLDQLAGQFASALLQAGVQKGDRVGLCIDRCPEAIAAMLGVMRIGAAFVPLDPEYPMDRILFMMKDAEISTVITHGKAGNPLAQDIEASLSVNWIDSCTLEFADVEPCSNQNGFPRLDDLAYIMYTSGSTGQPKGVQIEHAALTAYCMADIEVYRLSSSDRTLQFSTLNFDIAIEEIFPPLLIGGCVVVRPSERAGSANELSQIIEDYDVTAIHLATAYWHEWVDLMVTLEAKVPASLRLVIATGEKVSVAHFRRWGQLCEHEVLWCNAYGPTEATVTATVFIPDESLDSENMPIGIPLPGYEAYILDSNQAPVADGETGELWIGGPALARGYLNRPDLTEKAFVQVDLPQGRTRLYRTGDLSRWLPCGNIEFAGRIDHQIKLGSYRIEPGEIEAAINSYDGVRESLVCFEQVENQKFLIAYIAKGDNRLSIADLASYLREQLPPYMVPPRYIFMDRFPKTINGKIDREALPSPEQSKTACNANQAGPRSEMEHRLAAIWQRVLQVPSVGIHDDFFALGGSSLLVTRIVAELTKDLDVELPVRDFFANPTIASSAIHLERLRRADEVILDDAQDAEVTRRQREALPLMEPDFLVHGNRRLFHVRYAPRENPTWPESRRHAILMCHSLGHEYTRAFRNLQQLAVLLCKSGFDVIRFDYSGTGSSSGRCKDLRFETLQADLRLVYEHCQTLESIDSVSLLGVRLGATLAATTNFDLPPSRIALWDPVCDGAQFVRTLESFHHYALQSQTRYSRLVENSEPNQLYGHEWDTEKKASIGHLKLPQACESDHLVVLSQNYANNECGHVPLAGWKQVSTKDEIYWHSPEFAESAFASGHANRKIVEFFTAE